jgi:hypothetical protein
MIDPNAIVGRIGQAVNECPHLQAEVDAELQLVVQRHAVVATPAIAKDLQRILDRILAEPILTPAVARWTRSVPTTRRSIAAIQTRGRTS